MAGINWSKGPPPESLRRKELLVIATPSGAGPYDAGADNRPSLYLGHFLESPGGGAADHPGRFVPTWVRGMSVTGARPELNVLYWAEIDPPPNVDLRALHIYAAPIVAGLKPTKSGKPNGDNGGAERNRKAAMVRAKALEPIFGPRKSWSAYEMAKWLNGNGIAAPRGLPWSAKTVIRVRGRLEEPAA